MVMEGALQALKPRELPLPLLRRPSLQKAFEGVVHSMQDAEGIPKPPATPKPPPIPEPPAAESARVPPPVDPKPSSAAAVGAPRLPDLPAGAAAPKRPTVPPPPPVLYAERVLITVARITGVYGDPFIYHSIRRCGNEQGSSTWLSPCCHCLPDPDRHHRRGTP